MILCAFFIIILCAYINSGILGDLILCEGTFQIVANLTYYMNWTRLSQGWNFIIGLCKADIVF